MEEEREEDNILNHIPKINPKFTKDNILLFGGQFQIFSKNKKGSNFMKHILKETLLEFKLTYFGERLFGASVLKSILKSLKLSAKCFVDLLTPCNEEIF